MNILSLDSAGHGCRICVLTAGAAPILVDQVMERGQDQHLLPLIMQTIASAGITLQQLDRIAVTRGPGSFTGLRIGLAAAQGLGIALDTPVLGISRFNIYHAQFQDMRKPLLVVIQSRRAELYCRFYPVDTQAGEPGMMTPQEITNFMATHTDLIIAGDVDALPGLQTARENEALTAATLAAQADPAQTEYTPRPLYIRPPDVTMAKKKPVTAC